MWCYSLRLRGWLLARGRSQYRQHHQALRAGIADGVKDAGRGEGGIADGEAVLLDAHLNKAGAFQDNVEFVLALMSMRRVLLAGLERVQTGKEELSMGYRGLAHPGGVEPGQAH